MCIFSSTHCLTNTCLPYNLVSEENLVFYFCYKHQRRKIKKIKRTILTLKALRIFSKAKDQIILLTFEMPSLQNSLRILTTDARVAVINTIDSVVVNRTIIDSVVIAVVSVASRVLLDKVASSTSNRS